MIGSVALRDRSLRHRFLVGTALTDIVRAEPDSADEVFVVAQDDEGHVGKTIYGSSLHTAA